MATTIISKISQLSLPWYSAGSTEFKAIGVSKLIKTLKHLDWLENTLVTDVIPFRGEGPDALADKDLTYEDWAFSVSLLTKTYVTTQPDRIIVGGRKAQQWMRRNLSDDSELFQHASPQEKEQITEMRLKMCEGISWMASVERTTVAESWRSEQATPLFRHEHVETQAK